MILTVLCLMLHSHNIYYCGTDDGNPTAHSHTSTLTFDSSEVDKSFEGLYSCTVSNTAGKVKSKAARLTLGKE